MAGNDSDEDGNGIDNEHDDPLVYATGYHAPVLYKAVVAGLVTDRQGTYVDATLGGGGHAAALLNALGERGRVVGVDRDEEAIDEVRKRLEAEIERDRLRLLKANFADLNGVLQSEGISKVEGILLDLGVASHQLDVAARGFSYLAGGTLDMRMDASSSTTAADVVNEWSETELRRALFEYGEEPKARAITRTIVRRRPLETTSDLADAVRASVPQRDQLKSLSRVFQAIRIAVNRELEALDQILLDAADLVREGGRMAVISYHSLEDRRVKRFFRYGNLAGEPRRDLFGNLLTPWKELNRRPIHPDEDEIAGNPRSRSARLRVAERVRMIST